MFKVSALPTVTVSGLLTFFFLASMVLYLILKEKEKGLERVEAKIRRIYRLLSLVIFKCILGVGGIIQWAF